MLKKIKSFLTAKIFLTKGQVITQGMLYQLEKENADLRATVGGLKAAFTRQETRCALCMHHPVNAPCDHNVEKYYPENDAEAGSEGEPKDSINE
jgi:hypothetical protein